MAKTACEWSDMVILTSDNPRSEDPEQIIKDMEEGYDRRIQKAYDEHCGQAISGYVKTAVNLAQPGDIVLVAGKGHEKYQEIKGGRNHFDDKEELEAIFNQ